MNIAGDAVTSQRAHTVARFPIIFNFLKVEKSILIVFLYFLKTDNTKVEKYPYYNKL